jgi:hypothetical protein
LYTAHSTCLFSNAATANSVSTGSPSDQWMEIRSLSNISDNGWVDASINHPATDTPVTLPFESESSKYDRRDRGRVEPVRGVTAIVRMLPGNLWHYRCPPSE